MIIRTDTHILHPEGIRMYIRESDKSYTLLNLTPQATDIVFRHGKPDGIKPRKRNGNRHLGYIEIEPSVVFVWRGRRLSEKKWVKVYS